MSSSNAVHQQVYLPATAQIAHRPQGASSRDPRGFPGVQPPRPPGVALRGTAKQLIAVALAHTTQLPYCIASHTKIARHKGASDQESMEAIWVAAEMPAGGAYAHSAVALHSLKTP